MSGELSELGRSDVGPTSLGECVPDVIRETCVNGRNGERITRKQRIRINLLYSRGREEQGDIRMRVENNQLHKM